MNSNSIHDHDVLFPSDFWQVVGFDPTIQHKYCLKWRITPILLHMFYIVNNVDFVYIYVCDILI